MDIYINEAQVRSKNKEFTWIVAIRITSIYIETYVSCKSRTKLSRLPFQSDYYSDENVYWLHLFDDTHLNHL